MTSEIMSEETPLLSDLLPNVKHELVYQRFSPGYKKFIVGVVSWCGLMPLFISGTFYPSIPEIAKDLNTTGQNVSLAVSLSVFATSIGALAAASYSTFYGRRPVYLIALPLSIIGSIGVAAAPNMPQLLFWRFWQCSGASPGMAVGAGVIGDIYRLEERGTAMGFFLAGILLGPALAPPIGGLAAQYASWRFMQLCLGIFGLIAFAIMFFTFPETSHPGARGIDALRQSGRSERSWLPVLINPLQPLNLLRSPNVFSVSVAGFFLLLTDYVLLVPLAYTIGKRYHIDNSALIGACFLPCGLGNMVGAPIAGRISDKIIVHWKQKRGGVWYPEDRLRATLLGALTFVPLSVLGCGLVTHYIEGPIGLVLNLILLFFNGFGVDLVLSPSAAYTVDVLHSRSAEAMACNSGFRSFLLTFAIAGIMPMINTYGIVATNTLSAALAWIGCMMLALTIRYGDKMRAWVDVGYSNADNN
ncbi:MFS general substrate transporter [Macrolepiota fuliginosa MF-IS2]|uniref:MFS general substrate transporter n=1 Tax=Macrolepiota fuliginosa MF-IS2 TaxID=1400762 RepID=A0A9P5X9M4_9AGAR|nr:MFS general substrate transporter [Macrolepiota fuliginosa MF-IS2]